MNEDRNDSADPNGTLLRLFRLRSRAARNKRNLYCLLTNILFYGTEVMSGMRDLILDTLFITFIAFHDKTRKCRSDQSRYSHPWPASQEKLSKTFQSSVNKRLKSNECPLEKFVINKSDRKGSMTIPNVIKYYVPRKTFTDNNNNLTPNIAAVCNGEEHLPSCCLYATNKARTGSSNGSLPSFIPSSPSSSAPSSASLILSRARTPCSSSEIQPQAVSSSQRREKDSPPFYYFIREGDFDLVWVNILVFAFAHLIYFYGLFNVKEVSWKTWVFANQVGNFAGFSIGCGAHRLWSHKAYDACLGLRIFYAIGQTIAGQNCIYIWCRDHRVHHKFSDTDGDPHNTRRGYFFAHVGWLLRKKHPELKIRSKTLDFSDLLNDPVVRIQKQ